MFFKNKRVLVAGGTGLIGIPLSRQLIEQGAQVRIASLDDASRAHPEAEFIQADLTDYGNCCLACRGIDYVFNLLCVKGSPGTAEISPVNSFEPMLLSNALLLKAAWTRSVSGYLYASSVGVYQQADILREDDVWITQPSENDWFPGHAKRIGELHLEAYKKQYGKEQYGFRAAIVRPTNVYGPHDNFQPPRVMFIASIIRQFAEQRSPIVISGDGSQLRDFLHSEDAARGMILAAEKSVGPVNLASGRVVTVRKVVEILRKVSSYAGKIIYDPTRPSGDKQRIMDTSKLKIATGFAPRISLEEGLTSTYKWYAQKIASRK